VHVQILTCPVFGIDRLHGDLFICQQRDEMFAGGTACGEYRRGFPTEMGDGACHVDPPAAGLKHRGTAAEFTFRVNLRREGGGIEGRGERESVDRNHHYLLLAWGPFSLSPFGRKAMYITV